MHEEKLKPGEIVPVEIELYPMGLILYPGEQIRFIISANDYLGSIIPGTVSDKPKNKGRHIIHCGGKFDSYLQLPFKH